MNNFSFGFESMEKDFEKVKETIQHPHLNPVISKKVVISASTWASAKWGKNMDYRIILGHLGIEIQE